MNKRETGNLDRLAAEHRKLAAETEKLEAETRHLTKLVDREDWRLFFYTVGTAAAMFATLLAAARFGGS